jgi:osmoprotectant transport system permease protein
MSNKLIKLGAAGSVTAALSLFFPFFLIKENRIAPGQGKQLWEITAPGETVLFALLVILPLLSVIFIKKERVKALVMGILGLGILILVFTAAGFLLPRFSGSVGEYGRISMGFGMWVSAFAGYLLIASSLNVLDKKIIKWGLITAAAAGIIIILASGHLNGFSVLQEYQNRSGRFLRELGTHLFLSGTAVGIAAIIGIPLGVWAYRSGRSEKGIFLVVNSVQTIPSLALFGIMVAPLSFLSQNVPVLRELGIRGIGNTPALIALSLYALLPVTRNTFTSLEIIDKSMLDAGRGMGMGPPQLLKQVEIPLSLPVVLNGIRTALVQAIGNTTVAALIGAGGFGVFVFQGLGQSVPDLILLGTLPVIFLAVLADRVMSGIVNLATPKGIRKQREEQH